MAIAVAQQVSNPTAGSGLSNTAATTQTVSITPSAGSTLIVLARGQGGANAVTVADSVNAGGYTQLDADNDGNANWATFIKQNVAGSATTITGTWATSNANRGLIVLEISGTVTTGGAQTHVVGSTANTTPSMTPTAQPALVIGFGCTEGGSTISAGTGFTAGTRAWGSSGDGIMPESQRITSTSAIAATWTGGAGGDRYFGIILSEAASGLTLALTGVSATGSVGSVAPGTSKALTGNASTGSVGSVGPAVSAALAGNAATGSVGTLAPGTSAPLTGVAATGAAGTVTASGGGNVTVALTGVAATGSVGSVGAGTSAALTGVASTAAVGTMGAPRSLALTGVASNTGVGSITTSGGTLTGATALSRWKLDETSGTTLADSIGSNTLTLVSGYTLNVTPPAVLTSSTGAIRGTTNCIAARASATGLPNGSAAQSWSLWIKATSNTPAQAIFSLTNSGITAGAGLFLNAGSLLVLEYNGSVTLVSATAPSSGAWHHVAWTYDGAGGQLLYVDGTQVASATATPSASTTATVLLTTIDSGTTDAFAGDIDDVRVFSGVLTAAQVTRMAAGGEPNDSTVALTGVSSTASVGSVGPARALAVSGVASAAGAGSVGFGASLALSGALATGSVGSVGTGASPALTGVSATGGVGSVGASRSLALTGVAGTGAVGTISVNGNLTIALTGVVATGIAGTVAAARAVALVGVAAAGAVGSVGMNLVRALTGVSATGRVGNTGPPIPVTQVYPPFVAVVDSQQLTVDMGTDTLSVTGDT